MNSKISGLGHALPARIVENRELEDVVETSDQWIRERTGIERRHLSTGETTTDLAAQAGRMALADAAVLPEQLDLIVVATMTPDSFMPATACLVQKELGADRAACFDLSAACSGFVYGLSVADSMIRAGTIRRALVIGAETLSRMIDWTDRTTCVIFADGAGAAVLEATEEEGIIRCTLGASGDDENILTTRALPLRNYLIPEGTGREMPGNGYMVMDGQTVFRFSTRVVGESIRQTLENTPYGTNDLDWVVPHQANTRIIDYAASRLKMDRDKFFVNLRNRGNTSAASIPIALSEMRQQGELKPGQLVMLTGFGGGLTWGSALVRF